MSFPHYPKYKPSGVEWLGDVPQHWAVKRLKHNARLLTEKTDRRDHPVGLENIEGWSGRFIPTETAFEGEGIAFDAGDILFGKLRPYLAKAYLAQSSGEAVGDFHVMRPAAGIEARFAQYQILNREFIAIVDGSTFGSKMPRASWEFVGGMKVALPPLPEQTAIAEFLDRETGRIDGLVAEQRRLMELLKEKRQAVISHAVTKGLNPHAPMKPSGIEWLGDVPEGWSVKPLRSVFKFSKGLTITKENLQDEGVYCVNYGEVHSKYGFRLNPLVHPLRCVAREYLLTDPDALIRDGDFVFADTSEDLEGSGNFTHLRSESPIFSGYHTIIARPHNDTCSLFLAYQLHSSAFRSQIQRQVKGVKVFSISQGILKAAKCLIPPLPEQTAIAEFLETELAKFDTLTAEAQRAIDLLQERRTALISAAVTGQIDVQGVGAQGSD